MMIYRSGKMLRCGYTTGTCAAAAAKAAAEMLLSGKTVSSVKITVPKGITLELAAAGQILSENSAKCSVVKDSGDDPDITDGAEISAEVSKTESGIFITGGKGVGTVTRPGLDQPVGEYAINSVPRRMIKQAVSEAADKYGYKGGFKIVVSVPAGEDIARKTFNPRMGIEGGISIIGTTGIVEPMSNSAVTDTIRAEAGIRRAEGKNILFLTVGNYSEDFISKEYPAIKDQCVMCSNFIGDALDIGVSLGFEKILLTGHIGKLIKLGSGIMNTHSSYADGRIETLIACGALAGVKTDILRRLTDCVTVDAAMDILYENNSAKEVFEVMFEEDVDPEKYVEEHGMKQENDEGAIKSICEQVIEANPQSVADYKGGKEKAIGFLVGQVMKAAKGKADPGTANKILKELLQ